MPCNRNPATRRKKNAPCCQCLFKSLELVESEIELIKLIFPSSTRPSLTTESVAAPIRWVLSHQALLELATALHGCNAFADDKGGRPTFTALMRVLCRVFNITVNDIYVKRTQLFDRCKERTPFLDKLIETFNNLVDEHLK